MPGRGARRALVISTFYSNEILVIMAAALMITGGVAGLLAGLLGVGGGIVIVPVLFILFTYMQVPAEIIMHMAVATSLLTIIPISLSSTRAHHRRGAVDFGVLKSWGPFILLGAAIGGGLSGHIDAQYLQLLFGVVALWVAITMIRKKQDGGTPHPHNAAQADTTKDGAVNPLKPLGQGLTGRAISAAIGLASALMGIGGGTIAVPVMAGLSMPMHRAVGTAAAFGILVAVPGVVGFWWAGVGVDLRLPFSLGFVSAPAAIIISLTSMFTVPLGSRIAHALDPVLLRRVFGFFLLLSALNILRGVIGL